MFGVFIIIFTSSNMQLFWIGFSKPSATPLHTHTHIKTQLSVFTILMGLSNMQIKHCLMYFLRKENCYIQFRYKSEASMHDLQKKRTYFGLTDKKLI